MLINVRLISIFAIFASFLNLGLHEHNFTLCATYVHKYLRRARHASVIIRSHNYRMRKTKELRVHHHLCAYEIAYSLPRKYANELNNRHCKKLKNIYGANNWSVFLVPSYFVIIYLFIFLYCFLELLRFHFWYDL